jgi:hypothetical protein
MEFKFIEDLIKVFINEYTICGNKILLIDSTIDKGLFDFLKCEVFFVSDSLNSDITINYNHLPFENNSFDIVINLNEKSDLNDILRVCNGAVLTIGEIINGGLYYKLKTEIFTVFVLNKTINNILDN